PLLRGTLRGGTHCGETLPAGLVRAAVWLIPGGQLGVRGRILLVGGTPCAQQQDDGSDGCDRTRHDPDPCTARRLWWTASMSTNTTGSTVAPDFFASEQVITCHDRTTGLRAVIAIDNTTLGPGFGGTRWRPYASPEAAVIEAQRLAAAMTLKHACADLPYGGAKSVMLADTPQALQGPER